MDRMNQPGMVKGKQHTNDESQKNAPESEPVKMVTGRTVHGVDESTSPAVKTKGYLTTEGAGKSWVQQILLVLIKRTVGQVFKSVRSLLLSPREKTNRQLDKAELALANKQTDEAFGTLKSALKEIELQGVELKRKATINPDTQGNSFRSTIV